MTLVVCAAELVERELRAWRPSHLVSLFSPDQAGPAAPEGVAHLRLSMHDVDAPTEGLSPPARAQVAELLAFARTWTGARPLLVHCFAGVSRSPAAALAIACQRRPDLDEAEVARALRRVSPEATPNGRLLALADEILGRGGRLAGAGREMGRGADWTRPCAFAFDPETLEP